MKLNDILSNESTTTINKSIIVKKTTAKQVTIKEAFMKIEKPAVKGGLFKYFEIKRTREDLSKIVNVSAEGNLSNDIE